jgi:hypothetical protein
MNKNILVLLGFAFVGWVLCAATIGIGMAVTSLEVALILHAIMAPCFFTSISMVYFSRYHFLSPIKTALVFLGFVVLMDFFVVALIINHSLAMFTSLIGTWLPFLLIFLSTWITGEMVNRSNLAKKAR